VTLSEIKRLLTEHDLQLTASLGQNFLHDGNQVRRIVEAAKLTGDDSVLEIGPGLGPLTELLVKKARHVLAIEKDRRLHRILQPRFADQKNLVLVCDDAMKYLDDPAHDWSQWKVVANLPFSVASALLVILAQGEKPPQRMSITLQLEVAQRLQAKPGNKDYGVLSLLIQVSYAAPDWFKIPASCFFPEPGVDSACLTLVRRNPPLLPYAQLAVFTRVVKRGFSQRRKMMFKLLREDWPEERLRTAFHQAGIAPQARAETISLPQWIDLARILSKP
jgi:16S rRNA (adenine1518-N6/adenine1519-N6)-dimethyltransferase